VRGARAEAENKHLRFVVTYDPALVVRADLGLALSALQNLADNAVKFTDAGSVEIAVEDRGPEIAIHVRDTCAGLSSEELTTIFEPFHRGHTGKPGTGLGLAIASRAVRAQGGRIEVESQDEGCHFSMMLAKPGRDGRDGRPSAEA
jgi:signal transduction histidine kinase